MDLLLTGGLSFLSAMSTILLLGISAYIIAFAALEPPLYMLSLSITAVRACGLLRAVARYGERYFGHKAAFAWAERVNDRLFAYAAKVLPIAEPGESQMSLLVERLNTEAKLWREYYLRAFIAPVVDVFLVCLTCWWLYPAVGAYSLLLLADLLVCGVIYLSTEYRLNREGRQRLLYRQRLEDFQQGQSELVTNVKTKIFQQELDALAGALAEAELRLQHWRGMSNALTGLTHGLVFIILFYELKHLSGVELAVYVVVIQGVLAELANLSPSAKTFVQVWLSRRKGRNTDGALGGIQAPHAAGIGHDIFLQADRISFAYSSGPPVLTDMSFQIRKGQHWAIIGDSGTGKTTLFFLLLGLWQPQSGSLFRKSGIRIGASTQSNYIFSDSIRGNFQRLHPDISEKEIWRSLELVQLKLMVEGMNEGLETELGENGCCLSGGQRQRFLTALAVAGEPDLLLLDEPTSGVDTATGKTMMKSLKEHFVGRTMLIITHDVHVLPYCERIMRLS